MTDRKEDGFNLGDAGPSLLQLVHHYAPDTDDIAAAIMAAESHTYDLMRGYPEGVPSGVMLAGATKSIQFLTDLLAGMIVEIAGEVREWAETETAEQLDLTRAVVKLMSAHAMNITLQAFLPLDD